MWGLADAQTGRESVNLRSRKRPSRAERPSGARGRGLRESPTTEEARARCKGWRRPRHPRRPRVIRELRTVDATRSSCEQCGNRPRFGRWWNELSLDESLKLLPRFHTPFCQMCRGFANWAHDLRLSIVQWPRWLKIFPLCSFRIGQQANRTSVFFPVIRFTSVARSSKIR